MIFSDNKIALIEDNNKEIIRTRFLRFLQDNYMCKYLIENLLIFYSMLMFIYLSMFIYLFCFLS